MLTAIARNMCLIMAGVTLGITGAAAIYGDLPYYVAIPVGIAVIIIAALSDNYHRDYRD